MRAPLTRNMLTYESTREAESGLWSARLIAHRPLSVADDLELASVGGCETELDSRLELAVAVRWAIASPPDIDEVRLVMASLNDGMFMSNFNPFTMHDWFLQFKKPRNPD